MARAALHCAVVPAKRREPPEDDAELGDDAPPPAKRGRQLQRFSPENPLLTSEEVAELLGVSPKTVVQMAKRGSLPARHIPGTRRYLFFEKEIYELLDKSRVVPTTESGGDGPEEQASAATAPQRSSSRSVVKARGRKQD